MRKFLTTILVVMLILSGLASFGVPRTAHAIDGASLIGQAGGCLAGGVIANLLGSLLSKVGLEVPVKNSAGDLREQALDCAVWILNNIVIEQMTAQIVSWINSGFDGNPAFVDDLGGFLGDIADQSVGAFIESSDLEFLCSPFKLDIKIALLQGDSFAPQISCTLSGIVNNIDNFLEGDFSEGGWEGWFELTQKPQNNPYGAYLIAQGELARRVTQTLGQQNQKLEFGKGFFTRERCALYRVCEEFGPPADPANPAVPTCEKFAVVSREKALEILGEEALKTTACQRSETLTPGSVIENQLNESLNSPRRRIEVADELNEILGALFSQLLVRIFTDEDGLRGSGKTFEEYGPTSFPEDVDIDSNPSCDEFPELCPDTGGIVNPGDVCDVIPGLCDEEGNPDRDTFCEENPSHDICTGESAPPGDEIPDSPDD